jgi:hypothetical protein
MLIPTRSCLFRTPAQPRTQAATENQHNKMQNYCKTIGALAAATALVAGNASAEVEYELHTGYSSMYLFRGLDLGDDLIEVGVDAATEVNGFGLSAGAWYGSFDAPTGFGAPFGNMDADELDIYGEVSKDLGFANVAVGYIYYMYNQGTANTLLAPIDDAQEIYFSVGRDFGFLEASLTYFWDIETDNGGYTELALAKSFELSPCLTLNVGSNVSYLVEEGDFWAWTTKTSLDWGFAEHAKLSPFVALSVALDSALDDELVAGSMLSASF